MGWMFNPPPGWPAPPAGFVPPYGWSGDPSWPPPPPGWLWWVAGDANAFQTPASPTPTPDSWSPPAVPSAASAGARVFDTQDLTRDTSQATPSYDIDVAVTKQGWGERRAQRKADKHHRKAQEDWQNEQHLLDELAAVATDAAAGISRTSGLALKKGEIGLWTGTGALIEPRRAPGQYVGRSSAVSFPVAKGVRYRVGASRGTYVPGAEVQTPVDRGTVHVTTRRIVFAGCRATREWAFDKLVTIETTSDDRSALVHVSNRQKVSGLSLGDQGGEFQVRVALGITISNDGASDVSTERTAAAEAHRRDEP